MHLLQADAGAGRAARPSCSTPAWTHYQRHYADINGLHADVYPGVREGLAAMRARGWRLACVTNKPRAFALALLEAKGLRPLFEHVFGGDSFERQKPDPLPLLKTCEALGTAPARTLMVGDSRNDCEAARAAGCPVVLVSYGYNHGEPVADARPDRVIDRLDALCADAGRAMKKAARGPPSSWRAKARQESRLKARSTSAVWPLGVGLKRHWRTASTAAEFRLGLVVFITVTTSTTPSGPTSNFTSTSPLRRRRIVAIGNCGSADLIMIRPGSGSSSATGTSICGADAAGAASEPARPADDTPASTPPVLIALALPARAGGGGQRRRGGRGRRGDDDRRRRGVGDVGRGLAAARRGVGARRRPSRARARAQRRRDLRLRAPAAAAGRGAAAGLGAGVVARTRIQYIVRSVSFCARSAAAEAAADGAITWAIVAVLAAAPASIRTQRAMILKSVMAVVLR